MATPGEMNALLRSFCSDRVVLALRLPGNALGPDDALLLAAVLRDNWTLRDVTLDNNRLGSEGGGAIAHALRANRSVTSLSLSGNALLPAGMQAFAELMSLETCHL